MCIPEVTAKLSGSDLPVALRPRRAEASCRCCCLPPATASKENKRTSSSSSNRLSSCPSNCKRRECAEGASGSGWASRGAPASNRLAPRVQCPASRRAHSALTASTALPLPPSLACVHIQHHAPLAGTPPAHAASPTHPQTPALDSLPHALTSPSTAPSVSPSSSSSSSSAMAPCMREATSCARISSLSPAYTSDSSKKKSPSPSAAQWGCTQGCTGGVGELGSAAFGGGGRCVGCMGKGARQPLRP